MIIGLECKLYRNPTALTDTTWSATGWVEQTYVKDATLTLDKGKADTSTRASTWRRTRGTLKSAALSLTVGYEAADTGLNALRDAYLNSTPVALAVFSGPLATVGTEGLVSNWDVLKYERPENLEEGVMITIELEPRDKTYWQTIAGS